ncbi:MAG: hypothetical protein AB7N24_16975 [Dehalococcoidia bacterium]
MTLPDSLDADDLASDLPPGVSHLFGETAPGTHESSIAPRVLSHDEDSHLRLTPFAGLAGEFNVADFGTGRLSLEETSIPGEVHIEADMLTAGGPTIHIDAHVRKSWLSRTAASGDSTQEKARVVQGLFRLAEIPQQSTVKVVVHAD